MEVTNAGTLAHVAVLHDAELYDTSIYMSTMAERIATHKEDVDRLRRHVKNQAETIDEQQYQLKDADKAIAVLEAERDAVKVEAYWRARAAVANTPDPFEMPDGDTFSTGISAAIFSVSLLISNPGINTLDMPKIWKALRDPKSAQLETIDERLEGVQGYHEILAAFERNTAAPPEPEARTT